MQRRVIWSTVGCLLVVSALTACGGKVLVAGDVSVLVSERQTDASDALLSATLEVVDGCLGAGGSVVIWPYGTSITNEDPLTLDIPDRGTFALGDEVSVGGGFALEHPNSRKPGPIEISGVTVPAACAEHDVFLAS